MAEKARIATVVAEILTQLGIHPGEVTGRTARDLYGRWFTKAVEEGRIYPVRVGEGKNKFKWYSLAEINALKAVEAQRAHDYMKANLQTH